MLLSLYTYGYLHRIESSRRLEAEAKRNLEVMWLLPMTRIGISSFVLPGWNYLARAQESGMAPRRVLITTEPVVGPVL